MKTAKYKNDMDKVLSIQKMKMEIWVKKYKNLSRTKTDKKKKQQRRTYGVWLWCSDWYDFHYIKANPDFMTYINNLGYNLQVFNAIKPYYWCISQYRDLKGFNKSKKFK